MNSYKFIQISPLSTPSFALTPEVPPPMHPCMHPGHRQQWFGVLLYPHILLCGINGTWDLVVQLTGKARATLARTMLQSILDEARLATKTCTRASLTNEKANRKGKVRMECAAAMHFMWNWGWEKVIDACLQHPSVRQHQVAGKSWESVCNTWWENFASMCVFAWRSAWFSGADFWRLRRHSIAMGAAHNELQWGKLLWTHLWLDHMYFFAKKWRILSKFSCFAMEGSHRKHVAHVAQQRGPKPPPGGETRGASSCGQPHH